MGMNIAPKLAIYNELVCRALGDEAGTTLPAPTDAFDLSPPGSRMNPWVGGPQKPVEDVPLTRTTARAVGINHEQHLLDAEDASAFVKRATGSGGRDDWASQCRKSPAVNNAVASLSTTLTLIMGILSAATSGFWGALSDRRGRKPIFLVALFGMILMDIVFLMAVKMHSHLPGGYYFLLLGPALDGLLGGYSTASSTINAYISDCTDPGSRARIFSVSSCSPCTTLTRDQG